MHDDFEHESFGCRHHATAQGAADFTLPGAEPHYPPDLELEPQHLDIRLAFDIPAHTARGEVITQVTATVAGARALVLDAVDLRIEGASDRDGAKLVWRHDGKKLHVTWDAPFAHGESRWLVVRYRAVEPLDGLIFSAPDASYPGRAPWVGTDHETERARYWLPCVDLPAVRTTLDFHLTADKALTILANGLLVGEKDNGDGTKTAHWRLEQRCPSYLICLAIGDFVRADDRSVGPIAISYFGARDRCTSADLAASFKHTPEIMEWMVARLGVPFPFPKYYQFALPAFGGAMENISLVSWDDIHVADETFRRDIGELVRQVNVHEMAHSYFGDAVVIRDFAHAWLKESWATYVECLWLEDRHGRDEHLYELERKARSYFAECASSYTRPIVTRTFNSSWDMYDSHLYPGGAWRLHMLRRLLGDATFFAAVKTYLTRFAGKVVETDDFRRTLEEHSGRSLGKFFDQWFHGRGYPRLKIELSHDAKRGEARFVIAQTRIGSSGPCFDLELGLELEFEGGERRRQTFTLASERHVFVVPAAKAIVGVSVDPDTSLLAAYELELGDDILRRMLTQGATVRDRIFAADKLLSGGKTSAFAAVREAYAKEPFWGVRVCMAEALGRSRAAAAIPILASLLGTETEPRVQTALARQCATLRDPRITAALVAFLDRRPTYNAAQAALQALGAQRDEAHLPRLRAAADERGYRAWVRSGALTGLGATRTEAAFEELSRRLAYGVEPEDVRHIVPIALGNLAPHLPERFVRRAVDLIGELLRDPTPRVRLAAARALGAFAPPSAIALLEASLAAFSDREVPKVRRAIESIRQRTDAPAAALRRDLDELRESHRKLTERLDDLEAKSAPPPSPAPGSV